MAKKIICADSSMQSHLTLERLALYLASLSDKLYMTTHVGEIAASPVPTM